MTSRTWFRPVIGLVAALAAGILVAALVTWFAPVAPAPVAAGTTTAPVLAPTFEESEGYPLSAITGEKDVTTPGTGDTTLDLEGDEILDALENADDLDAAVEELTGDPCAPVDGAAPEGCPEGIHGTVLALIHEPALEFQLRAFPPSPESEYGSIVCPEVALDEGQAVIGILPTKPTAMTLTIIPDDTTLETIDYEAETDAALAAAWRRAFPIATTFSALPPLVECIVVSDLVAAQGYTASVIGIEESGRIANASVHFDSDGAPTRPVARFTTIGDNYIFTSALRPADQFMQFKAWITNDVEGATCAAPAGTPLSAIAGRETRVDAEELAALNVFPDYATKWSEVFRVPEGADLLLCARWYPRTDGAPSWRRDAPVWQTERFFGAPDRILPVLSVDATAPGTLRDPSNVRDVHLTVSTVEGIVCGETDLFVSGERLETPAEPVCDTSVLARGGATDRDNRLFWDVGFSGDLVLTVTTRNTSDEEGVTTFVVPASAQSCFGADCALPDPSTFGVAIAAVHEVYDCGENHFWELNRTTCTIVPQPDDGAFQVSLSWVQGLTNGVGTEWREEQGVDAGLEFVRPDLPQMDTTKALSPGPVDIERLTGSGGFTLAVDRRVRYTATILDASGDEACTDGLDSDVIDRTLTGTTSTEVELEFTNLCLGRLYTVQVRLRDNDGRISIWGLTSEQRWRAPRSVLAIAGVEVPTFFEWQIESADPSVRVGNVIAKLGNRRLPILVAGSCLSTDGDAASTDRVYAERPQRLGSWTTLTVTYWVIRPSDDPADEGCAHGRVVAMRTVSERIHLRDIIDNELGFVNVIITSEETPATTLRFTIGRG